MVGEGGDFDQAAQQPSYRSWYYHQWASMYEIDRGRRKGWADNDVVRDGKSSKVKMVHPLEYQRCPAVADGTNAKR